MPEVDRTMFEAHAYIADIPFSIINKYVPARPTDARLSSPPLSSPGDPPRPPAPRRMTKRNHFSSDHLPVGLTYRKTGHAVNTKAHVPKWVAADPLFVPTFASIWSGSVAGRSPLDGLKAFKRCIYESAVLVGKKRASRRVARLDNIGKLSGAITLLRLITKRDYCLTAINKLTHRFPFLEPMVVVDDGAFVTDKLRHLIGKLLVHDSVAKRPSVDDMSPLVPLPISTNIGLRPVSDQLSASLKRALPSDRSSLPGLRPEPTKDVPNPEMTDDPKSMAKIAARCYGKIWRKASPDAATIKEYLDRFQPQQEPLDIPKPTLDAMFDTIIASSNTSAGYDGIPFAAYRSLAKYAGPVLYEVLAAFTEGALPDGEFNTALLYLLPKKDTQLAADTRPISVGNTDTRLIAKCLLNTIITTAVLPQVLDLSQKGSITGRVGLEHVADLSNAFYGAAESQDKVNLYALFIDTRKAFDSLHHEFIFEVLRRKGFPGWVISAVASLLHQVTVTPFFGELTDVWIGIARGVKQGCPLSPLLFALCMDPLLRAIQSGAPQMGVKAYVDDIQAYSADLADHAKAMTLIDGFAAASGLGINRDKTVIIQAKDEPELAAWMGRGHCPWARADVPAELHLKIQDHCTALGFPVGGEISTSDVFSKPVEKMRNRLIAYQPTLRRMTPTKRYHVYNIFIHPLISYVSQACSIPQVGPSSWREVRSIAARATIPFAGRAFAADIAIAPRSGYSVPTPLRDPWASSVSTLAAKGSFAEYDGATEVEQPRRSSMQFDNMVKDNVADAVGWWIFANTETGKPAPIFRAAIYDNLTEKRRRSAIYGDMVKANGLEADNHEKLRKWLCNRGLPGTLHNVSLIHSHFAGFGKLQACVRLYQHYLPLNAVSTDERARHQHGFDKGHSVCHLCGTGKDHIDHLHGDCDVATAALERFGHCIGYELGHTALTAASRLAAAHLLFPVNKRPQATAIAVFNWASWHAGRKCAWTTASASSVDTRINRVVTTAMGAWLTARKDKWKEPVYVPKGARGRANALNRGLGSSGNRTAEQAARARAAAQAIVNRSTAEGRILAFSDGSSINNPGPAGAGAVVVFPSVGRRVGYTVEAYASLGVRGNNFAELWGNAMVFAIIKRHHQRHPGECLLTTQCSDSKNAIGVITYRSAPALLRELAHATRRIANEVNDIASVEADWVAGHADIPLNEHVDELAKRGAASSQLHPAMALDVDACIAAGHFIPAKCSSTPHLDQLFNRS